MHGVGLNGAGFAGENIGEKESIGKGDKAGITISPEKKLPEPITEKRLYPLVDFEGVDYAGKTTRCTRASQVLRGKGYTVYEMHYPRNKPDLTLGRGELLKWFLGEMKEDREKILEMLNSGIVMMDRYFYTTMAYQGELGDYQDIIEIIKSSGLIIPDVTFLVDAPPEELVTRVRDRKRDIFEENLAFQKQIREKYLEISCTLPFEKTAWHQFNGLGEFQENVRSAVSDIVKVVETFIKAEKMTRELEEMSRELRERHPNMDGEAEIDACGGSDFD